MAKTKKKPQKTRKVQKKPAARTPPLTRFMKNLWSKPELMEQFTSGRAGREKILENSVLSAKHAELVRKGCVRELMTELAGAKYEYVTSNINAADVVECGHAECNAFMAALKPRTTTQA